MTREMIVEEFKKIVASILKESELTTEHLELENYELNKIKTIGGIVKFVGNMYFGEDGNRNALSWLMKAIDTVHNLSIDDLK